ncbi:TIGR03757 family integrating conjugative element protein [Pseudomonas oryzihabitans]|uniref:TIGR03757 family integrating conjugative element protein n=1 Tax=Pseudomonas oryzihabitans TaxID=47885 RepID=UPI00285868AB|nr:TIGR03757 family integrating conjugative element protein [Pseudomonas psychrotolerans]MDR6680145.1 integrating conjugative element protein (TIGR03757 family) [Pseudomonas psychrotolerans]
MPSPLLLPTERPIRWARLAVALVVGCLPLARADVLAISDHAHPLTNLAGARVLLLDAPERLEQQVSEGLPADPHQAAALMQQHLRSASAQQLGRDLVKAHQDVADAWSLGVTKVPAVVVDRRYVVYGQPDVAAAVASIARYRSSGR